MSNHESTRTSAARKMGRGLGWFSVGLGLIELLATRRLARLVGLDGYETVLRLCGAREIANGIGILACEDARTMAPWVGGRLAGDAIDIAALTVAATRPATRHAHPAAALAAVAGVTALDAACTRALTLEAQASRVDVDYSDRTGIPEAPEQMRGAALATFTQPADMRVASERTASSTIH